MSLVNIQLIDNQLAHLVNFYINNLIIYLNIKGINVNYLFFNSGQLFKDID